jgi:hypothetical protein
MFEPQTSEAKTTTARSRARRRVRGRRRSSTGLESAPDPACASFHPGSRPMRLIDLCFFVAEHDDHHLAIVSRMLAVRD